MKSGRRLLLFPAIMFVVFGCARGSGRPETVPLSGTVMYQGKAVDGADVTFTPNPGAGDAAKPAQGKTDANGTFRVKTYFGPDDEPNGALAGDYTVTIRKIDLPQGIVSPENYKPPKNQLPERYADPKQSGLSATVKPGEKNEFPFALTD